MQNRSFVRGVRIAGAVVLFASACAAPSASRSANESSALPTDVDAGCPPPPGPANPNLVVDCSSFDTSRWSTFNTPASSVASSMDTAPDGGKAQELAFPTGRAGFQQVLTPAPAAGTYTASIYARVASPAAGQQIVLAYYHDDYPTGQTSTPFVPTTTWQRFGPFTFTVSEGDQGPSILVENVGGTNDDAIPSPETVSVWGLKIEAGSAMTDFRGCAVAAPPPPPPPGGNGLPAKIVGEWWWPWDPPSVATVQSQAPQVNYISLAGAFSNGGGGGKVDDSQLYAQYGSVQALKTDLDGWKKAGKVVVGMFGGGGDTTVIANAQNVTEFMNAAVPIIDKLGLQGVDIDLENTPDASSVASLIEQLKSHYGPSFIVAMAPRPFELRPGGVYRAVIQAAGIANIDLIEPQDYALNGDSLGAQRSYMDGDLADWMANLFPASKLAIGSFDPGEGESVSTSVQTYTYYRGVYPGLRGNMFWETREDARMGWQWAGQIAQAK